MTLQDLEQDLARRLNYDTNINTAMQTRLRAMLNEAQQTILSEPGMESLNNGSITFASVASTPQYAIPPSVARVKTIYETSNDWKLLPKSLDWYRTYYPDTAAITGTPTSFVDLGFTSVSSQPSAASQLLVDSTSASDTMTAYIEGFRTGGYFRQLGATMTGITAVNLGPSDLVFVTRFYLSSPAIGTVTLLEASEAGLTRATIPIGATQARYRRIALVPTPASAITYTVDFEYDAPSMENAKDEPILPPRFHRLLGVRARMLEYEKLDDSIRFARAREEYINDLRKLKYWIYSQTAGHPSLQGTLDSAQPSQLGGWYPAGS